MPTNPALFWIAALLTGATVVAVGARNGATPNPELPGMAELVRLDLLPVFQIRRQSGLRFEL